MATTSQPNSALVTGTLGLAIFAWSALFVWQGLDFTDMGFLLTTYQQFYTSPETNTFWLVNWLTAFIGHWLGEPFGGTVVTYKLAASGIVALTGIIAYQGVRAGLSNGWPPAIATFVTFLFITKLSGDWVSYNNLTALFYTAGAVLLFAGLIRQRHLFVILAGAILGANLFIRFPNVLGIALVMAVMLHGWLNGWALRETLAWSGGFLLGWGAGLTLITGLILAHGHADLYWQSLASIVGNAVDGSPAYYSGGMLLKLFVSDHLKASVLASLLVATGLLILRFTTNKPPAIRVTALILSALVLVSAFQVMASWRWAVPGLIYFSLLWIALQEGRENPQVTLLTFLAFTVLIIAPLGSDNGIQNAIYGQWLAMPLVLTWLWQIPLRTEGRMHLPLLHDPRAGQQAAATLVLALTGFSVLTGWFYCYRDSTDRFAMTHELNHPLFQGTYTTRERAQVVNELMAELPMWVHPGQPILAYPDLPAVHYLTRTPAWLENPWPILYSEKTIQDKLASKGARNEPLPIVVRSLGDTRNRAWPVNSPRHDSLEREMKWRVFDRFVDESGYISVWQNAFFEVLAPN